MIQQEQELIQAAKLREAEANAGTEAGAIAAKKVDEFKVTIFQSSKVGSLTRASDIPRDIPAAVHSAAFPSASCAVIRHGSSDF